jgi:hypothetical protein
MVTEMKTKILLLSFLTALTFTACRVHINDPSYLDTTPPAPPTGIVAINGDNQVDLSWYPNRESDVAGYNVYYAYSYHGKYTLIGSTSQPYFVDNGAVNGDTYYYAVTAYDYNGNESELSYDVVYSTPRPEGFNQSIFDYRNYPAIGGYSFTTYSTVPYDDQESDFFYENYNGTYYLDVWNDSEIQDMGYTNNIYDIAYAPVSGWSPTKDAYAIAGHTYVIWTWDNHYAKVRVKSVTADKITFDWAFQLVAGERQLKQASTPKERGVLKSSITR